MFAFVYVDVGRGSFLGLSLGVSAARPMSAEMPKTAGKTVGRT
jgi:hypothetical protein